MVGFQCSSVILICCVTSGFFESLAAERPPDPSSSDTPDSAVEQSANPSLTDTCAAGSGCVPPSESAEQDDAETIDLDSVDNSQAMTLSKKKKKAHPKSTKYEGLPVLAAEIISPFTVTTPEALENEIVSAEAALALRVEVDGAPAIYESPSLSIALRKVSQEVMQNEWVELKGPDGAAVTIPPGAKQMNGGPVTIMITSYHNRKIKNKKKIDPKKLGKSRKLRRKLAAGGGRDEHGNEKEVKEDRVDFFLDKHENETDRTQPARRSVSWSGTVDVKKRNEKGRGKVIKNGMDHGLSMQVPAHDRQWVHGEIDPERSEKYPEEKQAIQMEIESLVKMPVQEQDRAFRRLAKKWHPDMNPNDRERATELFAFLSELREDHLD